MVAVPETFFEFGDFRVDPRKRLLTRRGGDVISLTPKHFDTLLFLVENAGVVLEKDRIMGAVWPRMVVEENNLNQAVSQLRRLLGDDGAENRYILTVPRRGYRFVADVKVAAASEKSNDGEAVAERPANRWRFAIAAAPVAIAGVGVLAWMTSSRVSNPGAPPDKAVSAVAPEGKS